MASDRIILNRQGAEMKGGQCRILIFQFFFGHAESKYWVSDFGFGSTTAEFSKTDFNFLSKEVKFWSWLRICPNYSTFCALPWSRVEIMQVWTYSVVFIKNLWKNHLNCFPRQKYWYPIEQIGKYIYKLIKNKIRLQLNFINKIQSSVLPKPNCLKLILDSIQMRQNFGKNI